MIRWKRWLPLQFREIARSVVEAGAAGDGREFRMGPLWLSRSMSSAEVFRNR